MDCQIIKAMGFEPYEMENWRSTLCSTSQWRASYSEDKIGLNIYPERAEWLAILKGLEIEHFFSYTHGLKMKLSFSRLF